MPAHPYSQPYLGKIVTVVIDRPLGTKHPTHNYWYPVNYGFIEGTTAPDGGGVDAYVLGVFKPLTSFEGRVIAIIHRTDDDDDKLVVVPLEAEHDIAYTDEHIRALTQFQERFFRSEIVRS